MKLHEKNFAKISLRFYIFARSSDKLQELLKKRRSETVAFKATDNNRIAVGYHMDKIFALAERLYSNNLIIAASGPTAVNGLQAVTVENGEPFAFEMAAYGDVSIIVLTKDRTPFGEDIDEIVEMARKMLLDIADDAGAVYGELSIDGEVEQLEMSGDSLTRCEETIDERKARYDERRRKMAQKASDSFAELLLEMFSRG